MNKIIDGRALALQHEEKLKEQLADLETKPKVVSILIGDDLSSVLYTNIKQKKAQELGIYFEPLKFNVDTNFDEVAQKIKQLNSDQSVNGVMIQLPIPEQFLKDHSWEELPHLIDPRKDIDGLTLNGPYLSATAKAVMSILEDEKIEVKNKNIVVIGKSDLVGKPIARELTVLGGNVEIVDRLTQNPDEICREADILIAAAGAPYLVKKNWVKEGAVVIDVGTADLDGKVVGDVDPKVSEVAGKITPSPGGVGPMTVISLLENVVESVKKGI